MKKFYKEYRFPIWLIVLGIPALYCEVLWFGRTAAVAGCHSSSVYDGSYEARVYCNRKADALTWGRKRDFEGLGRVWTWDKDAEIYVIKGEMK